jgi:hypothetical protein
VNAYTATVALNFIEEFLGRFMRPRVSFIDRRLNVINAIE